MQDAIVRFVTTDGAARIIAVRSTDACAEAMKRHKAIGASALALCRAATCGLLMTTLTKDGARISLQLKGDGPVGGLLVDAQDPGVVRAFVDEPGIALSRGESGRPLLRTAVGWKGLLHVIRELPDGARYSGQVALTSGEIDEDLESYLLQSEQIESAVGADAMLTSSALIAAGGIIVQRLPNGDVGALLTQARARIRSGELHAALPATIDDAQWARVLAKSVLGDVELRELDTRPVKFECRCSMERVRNTLRMLPEKDLAQMIDEDGGAEVTCNFCRAVYRVGKKELIALRTKQ